MFKKIANLMLGLVALAVALGSVAPAWAASAAEDPTPPEATTKGTVWGGGQITAIGADHFTLRTKRGETRTIYVDAQTQFTNADAEPITFADVKVEERVLGAAQVRADGKTYALIVHVFPAPTRYRGRGTVNSVEAEEQAFTFTNLRGKRWEFYVDEDTEYTDKRGGAHSFDEIEAGDKLFVSAELRDDGKWWAVRIGFPLKDEAKP